MSSKSTGNQNLVICKKNTAEERPKPPQRKIFSSADEIYFLCGAQEFCLRRFFTRVSRGIEYLKKDYTIRGVAKPGGKEVSTEQRVKKASFEAQTITKS